MKLFRFFIISFVIVSSILPCYAQYDYHYDYSIVEEDICVTINPNIKLYKLPSSDPYYSDSRVIINIDNLKSKGVKKSLSLRVAKCINTYKQQEFNAYIVEYKNKLYVLRDSDVQDNSLLNERNNNMLQHKKTLEFQQQNLRLELKNLNNRFNLIRPQLDKLNFQLDSVVKMYKKQYTDSLNYYKKLKANLPFIKDSLIAKKWNREWFVAEKVYKEWYNKQPASTRKAVDHISVYEAELLPSGILGSCDYSFHYLNKSKKTIKYLHWTGVAYNAVDDPVCCRLRNTATCTAKDTGPIAPNEMGGGKWKNVIYEYTADTLKLNNISIIYMDGSSISIATEDIRRLLQEPLIYSYMDLNLDDIEDQIRLKEKECCNNINRLQMVLINLQSEKYKHLKKINSAISNLCDKHHKVSQQIDDLMAKIDGTKFELSQAQEEKKRFDQFLTKFLYYN